MKYKVIGIMSGTSLDGLDLAYCEFELSGGRWNYRIGCAETDSYTEDWRLRLANLERGTAFDLAATDIEYGHLTGQAAQAFIKKNGLDPDFIASHGHTIFHQPAKRITCQIGSGAAIAAETGIPVISGFRTLDVALGGQGAPLVPAGDRVLFADYEYCLNIGGFANISFDREGSRIAWDVCPANIVLNLLAQRVGLAYDSMGTLARGGKINPELLSKLNSLPYYHLPYPKSLGKEWVLDHVVPLLPETGIPTGDLLATFCEHIAQQVANAVSGRERPGKLLITGGGAWNNFLVERIRHQAPAEIVIPDQATVDFKEALIFAFLGVLRWRGEVNCLRSVTGAERDNSGGTIFY